MLGSGRVVVRDWRESDAAAIVPLANDREVWLGLRDAFPHPYTLDDAVIFLARSLDAVPRVNFAIEASGRLAGGIGYRPGTDVERAGAEIGYWIGRELWGRGIATEALGLVTRHIFATRPEVRRIFAVPFASNAASARVLEKAGYVREGTMRRSAIKDGRYLDQWMYAILRDPNDG